MLVSYGYGAGRSTWGEPSDFLAMDAGLVKLALAKAKIEEVVEYLEKVFGEDHVPYMGGWDQVAVEYLTKGTPFVIEEYDGAESLKTSDALYMTA